MDDKDKNEIDIIEENELTEVDSEEDAIVVSEYDGDKKGLIPIAKGAASQLSVMLGGVPDIANSVNNIKELGKTSYSITFKGEDVLPGKLMQKKNGSLFSNLKGEKGFGKQTDINPLDHTKAQVGNLVNIGFTVASVATSTYYLHAINSSLDTIESDVKSIKNLIVDEVDSGVERDTDELLRLYKELQDAELTGKEISETRLSHIRDRLTAISRDEGKYSIQYRKMAEDAVARHLKGKAKDRKESAADMKHALLFYGVSARAQIFAEKLLLELTEANDDSGYQDIVTKKENDYEQMYDSIISAVVEKVPFPKAPAAGVIATTIIENRPTIDIQLNKAVKKEKVKKETPMTDFMEKKFDEVYEKRIHKAIDETIPYDENFLNDAIAQIEEKNNQKQLEEVEIIVIDDEYYLPEAEEE